MKNTLLLSICVLISSLILKSETFQLDKEKAKKSIESIEGIRTINSGDTVVFDLTQIINEGNVVTFPVSIISDDLIQALDFSLKYNQEDFAWDDILVLPTNALSATQSFNQNDLTLRFTSFIVDFNQHYDLNSPIVNVRFNVLAGVLDSSDLDIVATYLNGEPSSFIVKVDAAVGLDKTLKDAAFLNVFPNPSSGILNITCSDNAISEMVDLNGRIVNSNIVLNAGQKTELALDKFAPGIYFLKVTSSNKTQFRKIIIE
jgi:hypothetical protein